MGEYGDWIVAVVPVAAHDERGYRSAIEAVLEATRDMNAFLSFTEGEDVEDTRHYTLRFSPTGEPSDSQHERSFWEAAVQFPALRPLVARYVEQVNADVFGENWQDEFHPRGAYAIAPLALADSAYCPLLGSLFFTWDLGHETFQEKLIDLLFAKHGMSEATMELLACRVCADGQATDAQVAAALDNHGFSESLDLDRFAARCVELTRLKRSHDIGLQNFASVYAGGDEGKYRQVWAAYERAGSDSTPDGFDEESSRRHRAYRTARASGHWDSDFMDSSVELLQVERLVPL